MKKRHFTPLAVLVILIGGIFYNYFGLDNNPAEHSQSGNKVVEAPAQLMQVKNEGLAPNKFIYAFVTKTVDGDTMDVEYKNKKYKVRLLCVDTPESVKQGVDVQTYSKDASRYLDSYVLSKKVKLVFEKGLRDRYGRLLAHVIVDEKYHINSMLVRYGYARVEIVSPNRAMKDYFYELQETAIREKAGMWGLPEDEQPFVKNSKGMYVPRYQSNKKAS